jgi:3-oxoacid CoA-transferase B subunit
MRPLNRKQIAWRAAQDLADGSYVNLGLGMPVAAANYAPAGREVMFHSENGIVGVGPLAAPGEEDADLVDAGSQRITLRSGAAVFDSAEAFAMIRGGYLDLTLLGAYQVSATGDLANWDPLRPDKGPLVGGAMDLAVGARSVRALMLHNTREGEPRLVERCSYPLTAPGVVDRVYTDLAVVDVTASGFLVREIVEGLGRDELQRRTGAPLTFSDDLGLLRAPEL